MAILITMTLIVEYRKYYRRYVSHRLIAKIPVFCYYMWEFEVYCPNYVCKILNWIAGDPWIKLETLCPSVTASLMGEMIPHAD